MNWAYRKHTTYDHFVVYQESPREYICDVTFEDDAKQIVRDHNNHDRLVTAIENLINIGIRKDIMDELQAALAAAKEDGR